MPQRARLTRGLPVAGAVLALGGCLVLGACGSGSAATTVPAPKPSKRLLADVRALRSAHCPSPYLVVQRKRYDRATVKRAVQARFKIIGHWTKLRPPVDWTYDPFSSARYRGELASLKWLDPLLYAYRHGNRQALVDARNIALDWIKHNPQDNPPTDKSWYNKIIGDRAPYIAYVARQSSCAGILSRQQALWFVKSLLQHGRALTSPKVYVPSNHGLYMNYGLSALAREASYLPKASRWRTFAPRRFEKTLLKRVYPSEGFWLENSSSYHLAVRLLLSKYVALAGSAVPRSLDQLERRMTQVAGWLIEPDGKRVLLGDSNLKATRPELMPLSRRDKGLLWLPKSGIAIVKHPAPDPSFLMFAATFQNGTHNQADALTFDLYANGQRIVTDPGLYDKQEDAQAEFSRLSQSHSVMTIDGQSFPLDKKFAYGSGLSAAGRGHGWYALEGTNPLARRQGVTHHRLLLYKPGSALLVIDMARSKDTHTYDRYFQLGPKVKVNRRGESLVLSDKHGPLGTLTSVGTGPTQLSLCRGQGNPICGVMYPHYRKPVPRTTARYETKASDLSEAATFSLDPKRALSARIVGAADPSRVTLRIAVKGGKPQRLLVVRHGGHLLVR